MRPWAAKHSLAASDNALLALHRAAEPEIQSKSPKMLYPDVLRAVQRAIARSFDVPECEAEANAFADAIRDWPPFPDSPDALAYLKQHYKLVILSNVDRESFAHSNAKLGVAFDLIVTAQDVGSYKPTLNHFHRAIGELAGMGVERDEILHVAQSLYHDIAPANAVGLRSVWADRRAGRAGGGATPPSEAAPDHRVTSLAELADLHRSQSAG